ncbi:unnamed protein product [Bathycoccus prasinos]
MATLASSHFLSPAVAASSFHRRHLCQRCRKRKRAPTTNKKSSNRPIPIPLSALSIEEEKQDVSHFINLKNGIEALPVLREHFPHKHINFMRMQSTLCERGDMEKIMLEVDANLLLKLATDRPCVIYDYGSRSEETGLPRSFWYGLESMMYFLRHEWGFDGYGEEDNIGCTDGRRRREVVLRGKKCTKEIERKRTFFSKSLKKKIRYYRQFIPETHSRELKVIGAYKLTAHDGDREYYKETLNEHLRIQSSTSRSRSHDDDRNDDNGDDDSLEATIEKLEQLGFKIFHGGDREQEWLDMIKSSSSSSTGT